MTEKEKVSPGYRLTAEKTESLLLCFDAPAASSILTSHAGHYTSVHIPQQLITRAQTRQKYLKVSLQGLCKRHFVTYSLFFHVLKLVWFKSPFFYQL